MLQNMYVPDDVCTTMCMQPGGKRNPPTPMREGPAVYSFKRSGNYAHGVDIIPLQDSFLLSLRNLFVL